MQGYLENVFRHRPLGRPRKPDALRARSITIAIRPSELEQLDELAKKAGMNRSRFVAACVAAAGPDLHDLQKLFARSRRLREDIRCSRCAGSGQEPFTTT